MWLIDCIAVRDTIDLVWCFTFIPASTLFAHQNTALNKQTFILIKVRLQLLIKMFFSISNRNSLYRQSIQIRARSSNELTTSYFTRLPIAAKIIPTLKSFVGFVQNIFYLVFYFAIDGRCFYCHFSIACGIRNFIFELSNFISS